MPSFDTVLEADFVEVKNAVDQVAREIGTRFDFKGTSALLKTVAGVVQLVQSASTPFAELNHGSGAEGHYREGV